MELGVPPLVVQAEASARAHGFSGSCSREVGALLRVLAARIEGTVLELGTGFGVGASWLLSAMPDSAELITIDHDAARYERTAALFAAHRNVRTLLGGWREALPSGPFDLVFVDISQAKDSGCDEVVAATSLGGMLVLDDFSPGPLHDGATDERWHRWMRHPRLAACEVLLTPTNAAILATKMA